MTCASRTRLGTCGMLGRVTYLLVARQELDENIIKALSKKIPQYLVFCEHWLVCSTLGGREQYYLNVNGKLCAYLLKVWDKNDTTMSEKCDFIPEFWQSLSVHCVLPVNSLSSINSLYWSLLLMAWPPRDATYFSLALICTPFKVIHINFYLLSSTLQFLVQDLIHTSPSLPMFPLIINFINISYFYHPSIHIFWQPK